MYDSILKNETLLDDLELIYHGSYKAVLKVWNQPNVGEDRWAYYEAFDVKGLIEIEQLEIALEILRDDIYDIIKQNKN